jgi:NADH-quinone oxidoreductase subunit F
MGSCGVASGADSVHAALCAAAAQAGADGVVKAVGCNGMCHREPLIEVVTADGRSTLYGNVSAEAARALAREHLRPKSAVARLRWMADGVASLFRNSRAIEDPHAHALDRDAEALHNYFGRQTRIVLENCGIIDPLDINDYLARDGYRALEQCLTQSTPERVLADIRESGLRGRGGAGFPTGRKWTLGREQPGDIKYVICNGDEGDPGAFMDRLILESDPHRVLEGLAIAAFAIGATEGYLYIRAEYPKAVHHVRAAIRQAEEADSWAPACAARAMRCGSKCGKARAPSYAARKQP